MEQKILFKVTEEQKTNIRREAEEKGLCLASYCRFIVLEQIKKSGETNVGQ